ncbi:DUF2637 domain-containing protein [Streptomyces sannanensis]|uniref:DUF2637 domain-containing protein n=1 Tax=Streptomyces sannanensis TaxID=285536 RepID=A0ABP6SCV5_9ACTN
MHKRTDLFLYSSAPTYDVPTYDVPTYDVPTYEVPPREGVGETWPDFAGEPYGEPATGESPLFATGRGVIPDHFGVVPEQWSPEAELARLLRAETHGYAPMTDVADVAPLTPPVPPKPPVPPTLPRDATQTEGGAWGHRRPPRRRSGTVSPVRTLSISVAALAAVIAAMVGVLSGMVSYEPLRNIAIPAVPTPLTRWWPLLVYGTWMVASLSILRATLHQRRATHSWYTVLGSSAVAIAVNVSQAPPTLTGAAAAALPPLAALACFQQLVRQITLTRPPRQGLPRLPRHRGAPNRR